MTKSKTKLMLHACPRCHGDLFPDVEDRDLLACLQCGRSVARVQLLNATTPAVKLAPAA